ncbi:threonine synthase [Thermoplasma volcanium GSS1]|uniref:Threonine synthase n=1 Tax=Thermoplasma volcanium (strain ATCC 51530 / DSM 4299 / JCM 9571 / NBRC 15438 / GSS1) TaxID=273116 RepID=Q97CN1_THEVO|nr:pyridoxal-phosphate dependent enzyme [Thermoplasma volcanium]BAB59212.1 threonine synthase [Thermoplasma volcanium GSS1]
MEELLNSETKPPGRTPTIKAYALGKELRLNNLFLKFEGANATGTQKDRISEAHVLNAIRDGYNGIAVGTCGNYGASIAYYANLYGIKSYIGMPSAYTHDREDFMLSSNAEILYYNGKYEETVSFIHDYATDNSLYDASPGSDHSYIDTKMYAGIAFEIYEAILKVPDYVIVPVGNGTTLSGIYEGFHLMYLNGTIDRMPRMVGVSTRGGNPIVSSWKRGYKKVVDLDPARIRETAVNEPLVSYRSFDGDKALAAIRETHGKALYVSDDEMVRFSELMYREEGLNPLPASASAVAALVHLHLNPDDYVVSVITGRRM